jgi:hypothetical protein
MKQIGLTLPKKNNGSAAADEKEVLKSGNM